MGSFDPNEFSLPAPQQPTTQPSYAQPSYSMFEPIEFDLSSYTSPPPTQESQPFTSYSNDEPLYQGSALSNLWDSATESISNIGQGVSDFFTLPEGIDTTSLDISDAADWFGRKMNPLHNTGKELGLQIASYVTDATPEQVHDAREFFGMGENNPLPESALEEPVITGGNWVTQTMDALAIPSQIVSTMVALPPGANVLDEVNKAIRMNADEFDLTAKQLGYNGEDAVNALKGGDPLPLINWLDAAGANILTLDPSNLIGAGIGKGIELGAKAAHLPQAFEAATKFIGKSDAIVDAARYFKRTAFMGPEEKAALQELIDPNLSERLFDKAHQAHFGNVNTETLDLQAKAMGMDPLEYHKLVTDLQEVKTFPGATTKDITEAMGVVLDTKGLNSGTPIPPGFTRLYRGESAVNDFAKLPDWAEAQAGQWFSTNLKKAEDFQKLRSGIIKYVDVPTDKLDQYAAPIGNALDEFIIPQVVQKNLGVKESINSVPDIIRDALYFKMENEASRLNALANGVYSPELQDDMVDYAYHMLTKEGRKALQKAYQGKGTEEGFSFGRRFNAFHSSQLSREKALRGMTISEINEKAALGELPFLLDSKGNKILVSKMFEDNPAALLAYRKMKDINAIADVKLITDAVQMYGQKNAPAHWAELATKTEGLQKIVEGYKFPREVAEHLNKVVDVNMDPNAISGFVKTLDNVRQVFVQTTLGLFPSTMTRNFVSNIYNNALADVTDPQVYKLATDFYRNNVKELVVGGIKYSHDEFTKLLKATGVSGSGLGSTEAAEFYAKYGDKGWDLSMVPGVGKHIQKAIDFGLEANRQVEDMSRIAHFIGRMNKGDTAMQAALSTKKYLFDYLFGLSDFEKAFMRRVFPFYTWTRFNTPLQIAANIKNPKPVVELSRLMNLARDEQAQMKVDHTADANVAQWIKDASGIPTSVDKDGTVNFFLLGSWLPLQDVELMFSPGKTLNRLLSMLYPIAKTAAEWKTNRDFFRNEEIEPEMKPTTKLLGIDMRKRTAHVFKSIRAINLMDQVTKDWQNGKLDKNEENDLMEAMQIFFGLRTYGVNLSQQNYFRTKKMKEIKGKLKYASPSDREALLELYDELNQ